MPSTAMITASPEQRVDDRQQLVDRRTLRVGELRA